MPKRKPKSREALYYQVVYYDRNGGHGSLRAWYAYDPKHDTHMFRNAVKEGEDFAHVEWGLPDLLYIGVEGSGDRFAIIKITEDYIKLADPSHFSDEKAFKAWHATAWKAFRTGKSVKAKYP